tara:strand:- start:77 stop:709 length:633 start_codon:yes stop_codon:yes gene_type:complete
MAVLKKNLERHSHCLGIVLFAITILVNLTGLSLRGNDTVKPTRAELRKVNLETAILVRSMDNLSWQTENLPPVTDHVIILVVGHDNCLFRERLAYLAEESNATIQGRSVRIESCRTLQEASKSVVEEKRIIFVVLLDSVSHQWDMNGFPIRKGLVVFGQGNSYLRRGLIMSSIIKNNRLKVSVNLSKLKRVNVQASDELLSTSQIFTQGR